MNHPVHARTVVFTAPFTVELTSERLLSAPDKATVESQFSAVSSGTEILVYTDRVPRDIPLDSVFAEKTFSYPCKYGYAVVGTVVDSPPPLKRGQRVFAFREHTSAFHHNVDDLLPIPDNVPTPNAVFYPTMETALSLAMDAAILPGETVVIVGQGIVGLTLVAALKVLYPYSTVVTLDLRPDRRRLSVEAAHADASLDPTHANFDLHLSKHCPNLADVSIDVSGSGTGLDTAIRTTRDHGRVVIGSWFGTKPICLSSIGGRFHRSHITLVASQVSHLPPHLTGRWSKERRGQLVWRLLADIRLSEIFPISIVDPQEAQSCYAKLEAGELLQVVFKYND